MAESLGPSPVQPLAAGPSLGPQERASDPRRLSAAPGHPAFRVDRWAAVDDAAYDPIRESGSQLGFVRDRVARERAVLLDHVGAHP